MSGNAPRAVNQAVQKRVKNGGPPETLWTSRHHRVRPEVGEDWGAASMRAAEEQSPPKKKKKKKRGVATQKVLRKQDGLPAYKENFDSP